MLIQFEEQYRKYRGEIEIITKDKHGNIVNIHRERNLVKIFAKEMLAHRLPYSKVWDAQANNGIGGWVDSGIDPNEEFAAKYILLGASFDDQTGQPLDINDARYYTEDTSTNSYIPVKLNVGADHEGDLIHPIPISEPGNRPLKRIESVSFQPSYQPSDSPLLDNSVRAINNVLVLETVLRLDEYNGFGAGADFFTITEVALAGGKALDTVSCDCPPKYLFLEGLNGAIDTPIPCTFNNTQTITLDNSVTAADSNKIRPGDQIYLVSTDGTDPYNGMDQIQPYYMVMAKQDGGHDITLDRTPQGTSGNIGIYRNSLRIFSQRILSIPFKKSSDFEITIRWLIYFN